MRVLHISARSDPGGGPEHIWRLIRATRGAVVSSVAAPAEAPYWGRFMSASEGRCVEIASRRLRLVDLMAVVKAVRENRCDLIHAHGFGAGIFGLILAVVLRVRLVITLHGSFYCKPGWRQYVLIVVRAFSLLFAAARICVSRAELESERACVGVAGACLCWINNGVDVDDTQTRRDGCASRDVMSISRFDYQKNSEESVRVAAELVKRRGVTFSWDIFGQGAGRDDVRRELLHCQVEHVLNLKGYTADVREELRMSRVFFSSSRWEGLPLAVLEAMAEGVPVVLSNVPGHAELFDGWDIGALYPSGDAAAGAEALRSMLSDTLRRDFCGRNARSLVRSRYSTERMASRTCDLYRSVARDWRTCII